MKLTRFAGYAWGVPAFIMVVILLGGLLISVQDADSIGPCAIEHVFITGKTGNFTLRLMLIKQPA